MGEVPAWYSHIRAAKYLGVPPWDLAGQPVFWRNAALVAESVEADAREQVRRMEEQRQQQLGQWSGR